ncbi:MAG TPA: hypothetical protein ENH85_10410 [Candidatus Scalindua sp.]|nr:hypothetical protein [Candidatus Scalindua sp.]
MAKENKRQLIEEERTETIVHDKFGREELRFGLTKREYEEDGIEYYEITAENFECGDGVVVSYSDMMNSPSQGGVTLERCDICQQESRRRIFGQNQPVNQFSPVAKRCFHCQANLCGKHQIVFEGHIVCRSCKRYQFLFHKVPKTLFFRRVQET